jgi:uncharacterized membrane protein
MHRRHKHDIIVILSMLGFADSVYLTVYKVLGIAIPCTITHGCETVLSSKYSAFLGVPLAVWGIVFFSGIIVAALLANHYQLWRKLLTVGLGLGSLASLIFLALQFFVIKQVCQYCFLSDVLTIILLLLDMNIEHYHPPHLES